MYPMLFFSYFFIFFFPMNDGCVYERGGLGASVGSSEGWLVCVSGVYGDVYDEYVVYVAGGGVLAVWGSKGSICFSWGGGGFFRWWWV
ncbi:hypothetical protein HanPSC8_Chr15g0666001 [Helianthus annuus]|nr:hypothetical protein HanPSC8_Chr15g0666001 [Helianthus annuus]